MFFLKKLLQLLDEKGFRAERRACTAMPQAGRLPGRAVRRESEECSGSIPGRAGRMYSGVTRARAGAGRQTAAGLAARPEGTGAEGEYAWYFAVRGFFARSAAGAGRRALPGAAEADAQRPAEPRRNFALRPEFTGEGAEDEFFAALASLRGLNVEERLRGGTR